MDASRELRQQRVAAHLTLSDPEPKDLHTTTALREQLELKRRELKAAKAELSFTGDIMDMLRADIAKSDAESESRLQVVQEAKDMKLRIAAEVDVLSEQISTRDLIMSDLRFNLDQACTDRDLKEKNYVHYVNTVTYNTLITGLGNVGRIDDAMELFEEMKREGIERDTVTYNTLITGLGSVGRIDDAMELFEEMKR